MGEVRSPSSERYLISVCPQSGLLNPVGDIGYMPNMWVEGTERRPDGFLYMTDMQPGEGSNTVAAEKS